MVDTYDIKQGHNNTREGLRWCDCMEFVFTSICMYTLIRLFRIISIPSKCCYVRPPDHVISMELLALNFRCQCTQQKLQSICAVLTFDLQLKKILTFSVRQISIKLFYLYQRLPCRDKYFFKIKFVFFLYLRLSASSSKENDLPLCIYFWYQTDSGVQNSIYSDVSLASPYYNYL